MPSSKFKFNRNSFAKLMVLLYFVVVGPSALVQVYINIFETPHENALQFVRVGVLMILFYLHTRMRDFLIKDNVLELNSQRT